MTRADIKAELPGEQYTPSNGTEGAQFLSDWCGTCARDKSMREGEPLDECDDNETCPIIAASFRGEEANPCRTEGGLTPQLSARRSRPLERTVRPCSHNDESNQS